MPLQVFIKVLAWRFSEFCLKTFGEVRVIGKAYHVHHFGNGKFLLFNNMAAFFIRIDLMYSTGDIPVSCLIFR